ncbi:chorismate--pyruvate lyase family protein [Methanococcoides sp. FTZ1]|uniref:chorismate--pyruvate lyase family protein n=1 Tax=Methanococcoides sp. FTZ1 TaxID=3439061 RepID=UPI003F8648C0
MTFVNKEFLKALKSFDIPTCLRVCAGTDGSVTFLLEIMTREDVTVVTEAQHLIQADEETASLLDIAVGSDVNYRLVTLLAGEKPFVRALSLSPIERMPEDIRQDLMRADIPIGKILRNSGIETRRDFDNIEITEDESLFDSSSALSRSYHIVHDNKTLMWINEKFPVDDRWNL